MFEKSLVAYCDPWSVSAGQTLAVKVSCHIAGDYQAELVELICGDNRPRGTGFHERPIAAEFAGSYPGREQPLRTGSYALIPGLPGADRLSFCLYVYPTTPDTHSQSIAAGGGLLLDIVDGRIGVSLGGSERLVAPMALHRSRWHKVLVTYAGSEPSGDGLLQLSLASIGAGVGEADRPWRTVEVRVASLSLAAGDWLLAASMKDEQILAAFNGRIEAPRLVGDVIDTAATDALLAASVPEHADLLGAWDFALVMDTDQLRDVCGTHHGRTLQMPTRAVKGARWDGSVQQWQADPAQYGAIHFHADDLADAGWFSDFEWQIPAELASGVYAVKLTQGGSEDYVPFFVRPAAGQSKARIAYLAATATYLAYANQRLGFSGGIFGDREPKNADEAYLLEHPEVGYSLYEYHADGSGVHFSSRLRPILNMKPKTTTWSFNADTNLTNWLHHAGEPFDVITDEDLHREGESLLAPYDVVITGTHPEYYSTSMLDGVSNWLNAGGRLMYMGGNGFYWRVAYHPDNPAIIEVRRAEDGTRAWIAEPGEYYHAFSGEYGGLWRRLGRPPNHLTGVGFAAQGFDGGTYYRLAAGALDERAAFIMAGVEQSDVIGDYGSQGGGAAGEEIDRLDYALGSPRHALCIASSENHRPGMLRVKEEFHMTNPQLQDRHVRADMVFFETPSGGAVFSTGSISYAGAIAHNAFDNDIARITNNVLQRFLDTTPFEYPMD